MKAYLIKASKQLLFGWMGIIVWLVVPDIKVIGGKVYKRRYFEFGEPVCYYERN